MICNQSHRSTQPGHPFVDWQDDYQLNWGENRHTIHGTAASDAEAKKM